MSRRCNSDRYWPYGVREMKLVATVNPFGRTRMMLGGNARVRLWCKCVQKFPCWKERSFGDAERHAKGGPSHAEE